MLLASAEQVLKDIVVCISNNKGLVLTAEINTYTHKQMNAT